MSEKQKKEKLPEGWLNTTLGEVTYPSSLRVNPRDFPELPYIGLEQIESHTMQLTEVISSSNIKGTSFVFYPNDVLYARMRSYLNKVYRPMFEGICSTEFIIFSSLKNMSARFLQHILNSSDFVSFAIKLGSGDRPRIKYEQIAKYPINLPPLEEQEQIVEEVETIFDALNTGKNTLITVRQQLETYRQLIFSLAFEGKLTNSDIASNIIPAYWRHVKLKDVCEKIFDGTHFSPKNYPEGDYKYITAKNIKEKGIDLSDITYVTSEDHHKIYSKCDVKKEDVLYIKDGATTGVATINTMEEQFSLLSSVAVFRVDKKKVIPKFLTYFLNSARTRERMLANISGVAITRLTLKKLNDADFVLVPIEEQQRIIAKIDNFLEDYSTLENIIANALTQIEELKQSVLEQAFTGRLIAQNKQHESATKLIEKIKIERQMLANKEGERRKEFSSKKSTRMAEELKDILQILEDTKEPVSTHTLWQSSKYKGDIDKFYSRIKELLGEKKIKEIERNGKESFLELTDPK